MSKRVPIPVTPLDRAFGKTEGILPPMSEIPSEFKSQNNAWVKWQQQWFFEGLQRWPVPRDGVDLKTAMANLGCVQASFDPKHEHKEAGVAYLASLWFSSPNGEPIKKTALPA